MVGRPQDMVGHPQDVVGRPQDMVGRPQALVSRSISTQNITPRYAVLDKGTNYCNLRNLVDGAG